MEFLSERELGKPARGREKKVDELRDGMSMFGSLEAARTRWLDLAALAAGRGEEVRVGNFIAEVSLGPGSGVSVEDLGEVDEHLTIWGDPEVLAGSVTQIYPAKAENG